MAWVKVSVAIGKEWDVSKIFWVHPSDLLLIASLLFLRYCVKYNNFLWSLVWYAVCQPGLSTIRFCMNYYAVWHKFYLILYRHSPNRLRATVTTQIKFPSQINRSYAFLKTKNTSNMKAYFEIERLFTLLPSCSLNMNFVFNQ